MGLDYGSALNMQHTNFLLEKFVSGHLHSRPVKLNDSHSLSGIFYLLSSEISLLGHNPVLVFHSQGLSLYDSHNGINSTTARADYKFTNNYHIQLICNLNFHRDYIEELLWKYVLFETDISIFFLVDERSINLIENNLPALAPHINLQHIWMSQDCYLARETRFLHDASN